MVGGPCGLDGRVIMLGAPTPIERKGRFEFEGWAGWRDIYGREMSRGCDGKGALVRVQLVEFEFSHAGNSQAAPSRR